MLICLSSDLRVRYTEDILRSVSMPVGTRLLLRYRSDLIPDGIRSALATNGFKGTSAFIALLDTHGNDQTVAPEAIPCRMGSIVESRTSGDAVLIEVELDKFWVASDIGAFNREMASAAGNVPHYNGPKVQGSFVHKVDAIAAARESSDIEDWAKLTSLLHTRKAFAKHPFFYFVCSISPFGADDQVRCEGGRFPLTPNANYTIRIRTAAFQEVGNEVPYWLFIAGEARAVSFFAPPRFAIDSPYDEKVAHFRTVSEQYDVDSALSLYSQRNQSEHPDQRKSSLDFDVLIRTRSDWMGQLGKGLLVGAFLAAQGISILWLNPATRQDYWGWIIVGAVGLGAGLLASFKIRKL